MESAHAQIQSESESFEQLINEARPRIRRVLSSYRIPPQDAEDVIQEALLAAFLVWPSIQNKVAWLTVTLRRKCSLYWRSQSYRRWHGVDPEFLEDLAGSEPPRQEREEMYWDLDRLLDQLASRHQELVRLRFGLGLSPEEAAERLGYNPSSIRKVTCRALARLQKKAGEIATFTPR